VVPKKILQLKISILQKKSENINKYIQKRKNISKSEQLQVSNFADLLNHINTIKKPDDCDTNTSKLTDKAWTQVIQFYSTLIREPVNNNSGLDLLSHKYLLYLYLAFPTLNPPTTVEELNKYLNNIRATPQPTAGAMEEEKSAHKKQNDTNSEPPKQYISALTKDAAKEDTSNAQKKDITDATKDNTAAAEEDTAATKDDTAKDTAQTWLFCRNMNRITLLHNFINIIHIIVA